MISEDIINKIYSTNTVVDEFNNTFPLHSNIDKRECEFLKVILKDIKPIKTIEIGCAYGISSLIICSMLENNQNSFHTIIDPHQSTEWKNIGIMNLKRAGIGFYEFLELPSEIALPKLLSEGKTYDFGLIDGYHSFDQTLLDFYYLNRLIEVGGVIIIDDISWPSINKFMRFIVNNYPCYRQIDQVEFKFTFKRNIFEIFVKSPLSIFTKILPKKIANEIFSDKVIKKNKKLKLNSTMVALKKIEKDNRSHHKFEDF